MEKIDKSALKKALLELSREPEKFEPMYIYLSQKRYDYWKAEGRDMTWCRVSKPLPKT